MNCDTQPNVKREFPARVGRTRRKLQPEGWSSSLGQQLETFSTAKYLPPERFLRGDWLNMIEEAVNLKNIAQHVHIDLNGAEKCSQYLMQYLE